MVSLLERRREVERQEQIAKEQVKINSKQRVANRILKGFNNEKLISLIEEKLVERGRVCVTGFGYLCQGSFCSDTKGFPEYLKDFEQEWRDKGVDIFYSIDGVFLTIKGAKISGYGTLKIHHETLKTSI